MIAKLGGVKVISNPSLGLVIGLRKQAFQQMERQFGIACERKDTSGVMLGEKVVGVDCQCTRRPCPGAGGITDLGEGYCAEISVAFSFYGC